MKPAVDEMFPEGAGPYVDLDEAGGSTGLLMDLAANEKAVHADFFNALSLSAQVSVQLRGGRQCLRHLCLLGCFLISAGQEHVMDSTLPLNILKISLMTMMSSETGPAAHMATHSTPIFTEGDGRRSRDLVEITRSQDLASRRRGTV
ncbi:Myeloma-overexpressed gene 2-like protein [Sciurus carolinensis]|uniref:COP9 signalosome complex subunit 9 n=1 Tax=Sciurus carolinensis TaxID=30640 RepID=A0AA41MQ76_SCICA|nr:Myeloma-overexpressed gene 2-like protein [Sciurus carolinensis]